ncbi:hypothetical protein DB30_00384 [Enhygromyxa salina]|uniref:Uncharacterized protein n=1 Tax=Enhygromyxa salina TaxID=215803 RepID=A0A0C1Z6P5_9BACT|nr:hypothetical protein DB30_00384 [Enhygromyxa salina]
MNMIVGSLSARASLLARLQVEFVVWRRLGRLWPAHAPRSILVRAEYFSGTRSCKCLGS